jgi:hypothetical protein
LDRRQAFQPHIDIQSNRDWTHRDTLHQHILDAIATHRVADRPDRYEPRVRKRRPKHFEVMIEPRHILKRKVLK